MHNYKIHMPESTSPGDCLGAFGTSLSAIGLELGGRINEDMSKTIGPGWLEALEKIRFEEALQRGKHYKKSFSPYDFNWIVNEPFYNNQSPIRKYLPITAYKFFDNARELVETRNRWYHDYNPHNINDLVKALDLCSYVASKCELGIAERIEEVRKRALELKSGTYIPDKPLPTEATEETQQKGTKRLAQVQRAVGAVWLGDLPERKIALKESGALVDESKQANVTSELTNEQQERYLKLWKLLMKAGWLWVDELGQVAAYIQGVLRCVGFWGKIEEPAQDPFTKFLLPHSYELTPELLLDRGSGASLDEQHLGNVTASTLKRARMEISGSEILRVTWDGDLICFGSNGAEYFGEVESQDWFLGHFAVETAKADAAANLLAKYKDAETCERCEWDKFVPHNSCVFNGEKFGHSKSHCTADVCY